MRLAALISGGKDSVYAARIAQNMGHELAYLVSMKSANPDSYMLHTVNINLTELQAEAWNIPYIEAQTQGVKEKELADIKNVLKKLDVSGVITGAIASQYQADRINSICRELDIEHLSPLWGHEREILLTDMLNSGMKIIFTAVAAHGLDHKWLGKQITYESIQQLKTLNQKYGVDMCGEGGEYETLVLNAPWFTKQLEIIDASTSWDGVSGRYIIEKAVLRHKEIT